MVDCRGASISEIGGGEIGGRCLICRASWPSFAFDGLTATIAFYIHLEDHSVMYEAVDRGERHGGVWKDLAPFAEGVPEGRGNLPLPAIGGLLPHRRRYGPSWRDANRRSDGSDPQRY